MIFFRLCIITFEIANCTKEKMTSYKSNLEKHVIHGASIISSVSNFDSDTGFGYINQIHFVPLCNLITGNSMNLNDIKVIYKNYFKERKFNDIEIVRIHYCSEMT